jgi:hypothetical protein
MEKGDENHPVFPPMSEFYKELKTKIEDYFITNKINPRYANPNKKYISVNTL